MIKTESNFDLHKGYKFEALGLEDDHHFVFSCRANNSERKKMTLNYIHSMFPFISINYLFYIYAINMEDSP